MNKDAIERCGLEKYITLIKNARINKEKNDDFFRRTQSKVFYSQDAACSENEQLLESDASSGESEDWASSGLVGLGVKRDEFKELIVNIESDLYEINLSKIPH